MILYMGLANFGDAMFEAIVVVFLIRTVDVPTGVAGVLMAAISIGGIVGATIAVSIGRRFGSARAAALRDGRIAFYIAFPSHSFGVQALHYSSWEGSSISLA